MWANVQRDGRPAAYRWRHLFNAAKFGRRPLLQCRALTPPRRETVEISWGAPNYRIDLSRYWAEVHHIMRHVEEILLLSNFFSDCRRVLVAKIARQSCAMVPRWRFLAIFLRPVFSASRLQHISDLHSKFALRPHHVWKYARHPICDG